MASALPKRILVTGAAGVVGRAVVKRLQVENVRTVPVVRESHAMDGCVVLDLSENGDGLLNAVKEPPEAVVHLAAVAPPRYPDISENAEKTIQIDRQVVAAARTWGARYLYISTCGLYDPMTPDWKDEEAKINPRTPYFSVKKMGEEAALEVGGVVFRISSPFGEGMMPTLVVPRFIDMAIRSQTISVWGSGKREQDFISVNDIANAVVRALAVNSSGVFNIASGMPMSMIELARSIVDERGRGVVVKADKVDPLDGQTARFKISRAAILLGWTPKASLKDYVRRSQLELR